MKITLSVELLRVLSVGLLYHFCKFFSLEMPNPQKSKIGFKFANGYVQITLPSDVADHVEIDDPTLRMWNLQRRIRRQL